MVQSQFAVGPQDEAREAYQLSPEEQEQLDKRLTDFNWAKETIIGKFQETTPIMEQQTDPIFARYALVKCLGQVMETVLHTLSYSEAMSLLAVVTQDLSDV